MDEHDLEAVDIQSIDVRLAHDALAMIDGNDLWTHNIQFIVALAAHEKSVQREHFVPEWTANGAILNLATRVVLTGNDALQQRFPGMQGAWLRLTATDGASFEIEVPAPIGTPDQPMTPEVLKEKFDALAGSVLSGAQVSRLWQLTAQLDELTDLSELFSLLACPEQ
jgi:2-methylcitrate dehydratase PrpD